MILRPEKLGICLWSHDRLVFEPEQEPGIRDTKLKVHFHTMVSVFAVTRYREENWKEDHLQTR